MPGGDPNLRKFKRHLSTARRELRTAVERTANAGVDFLPGHKAEMVRRAQAVRDAADELVRTLSR